MYNKNNVLTNYNNLQGKINKELKKVITNAQENRYLHGLTKRSFTLKG